MGVVCKGPQPRLLEESIDQAIVLAIMCGGVGEDGRRLPWRDTVTDGYNRRRENSSLAGRRSVGLIRVVDHNGNQTGMIRPFLFLSI
jgi:hypothetical protein